jgi:hypothetical protein
MDISGLWNQLLLNTTTVCLHPNSLIDGIQVITPYVTSSDTNSSLSSESSVPLKENENEADGDNDKNEESNSGDDEKGKICDKEDKIQPKKSIQRVRLESFIDYCKLLLQLLVTLDIPRRSIVARNVPTLAPPRKLFCVIWDGASARNPAPTNTCSPVQYVEKTVEVKRRFQFTW